MAVAVWAEPRARAVSRPDLATAVGGPVGLCGAARASLMANVWAGPHIGARSRPDFCYCVWWASVGAARGHSGPFCGGGRCLGGATRARGLARIFAIAFGGLRCGCADSPGPRCLPWRGPGGLRGRAV